MATIIKRPPLPRLGAFPLVSIVPASCRLIQVTRRGPNPYFQIGDYAVVETDVVRLVEGDVYAVQQSAGPAIWRARLDPFGAKYSIGGRGTGPSWNLVPLMANRPEDLEPGPDGMVSARMSDGPLRESYLLELIIGRVVGKYAARFEEPRRLVAAKGGAR